MTIEPLRIHLRVLLACALLPLSATGALAQNERDAPPPPKEPTPDQQEHPERPADDEQSQPEDADDVPSLDELLGLEEEADRREDDAPDEPVDPERAQLERQLEGADISEVFEEAVRQMGDAADLLSRARDPGARTQRLHDEILTKLDVLIEQAEQQSQQSSSSSSSSSQRQAQQQRTGQQQQRQASSQRSQGEPQEQMPPGAQEAQLSEALDAARAAWGALPERVRDALVEGTNETFSSIYKRMTESYYKRLAEEGDSP
jgi:hypothetical protein